MKGDLCDKLSSMRQVTSSISDSTFDDSDSNSDSDSDSVSESKQLFADEEEHVDDDVPHAISSNGTPGDGQSGLGFVGTFISFPPEGSSKGADADRR
jgi:hypothetical protein